MRNGFKVFDTDTHLNPSTETIEPYFDAAMRARLPELAKLKEPITDMSTGARPDPNRHQYAFPGRIKYKRILGQAGSVPAAPVEDSDRNFGKFRGTVVPNLGSSDDRADLRIKEMDTEGVDAALMIPGIPTGVFVTNDPALEMGLIRAHNRYLDDFCGRYPNRLKSLLTVSASAVDESLAELKRWRGSRWAVGVWPIAAAGQPIDHPDLEPIWKECAEQNLCVVYHSYTWFPPYFPGYRDVWDNVFLGRSAAHPWGAMRFVAAFIGAGIMDRYPTIRCGILEGCCGWLPFWARRLDDQAKYVGTLAPLKHRVSDYMTGGRFFSSIEMEEGDDLIRPVIDFLGDGVLMYASDFPHAESQYPDSVDNFCAWRRLTDEHKRKMLWDNPARFYGVP